VHLYSEHRAPTDTGVAAEWRYDRVLLSLTAAAKAGASKPFLNTEFGWRTPSDVDERTQADYIVDALRLAVVGWRGQVVERSFIYTYEDPSRQGTAHEYNLLRRNGSTKPAWAAASSLILGGRN
jgi:hypothetical protein